METGQKLTQPDQVASKTTRVSECNKMLSL